LRVRGGTSGSNPASSSGESPANLTSAIWGAATFCRPGRHASRVAEDVLLVGNHIAEIDPDAELDPLLRRGGRVAIGHSPLHLHRASDGIDYARKLPLLRVIDMVEILFASSSFSADE
jgi:hypothetical protein